MQSAVCWAHLQHADNRGHIPESSQCRSSVWSKRCTGEDQADPRLGWLLDHSVLSRFQVPCKSRDGLQLCARQRMLHITACVRGGNGFNTRDAVDLDSDGRVNRCVEPSASKTCFRSSRKPTASNSFLRVVVFSALALATPSLHPRVGRSPPGTSCSV